MDNHSMIQLMSILDTKSEAHEFFIVPTTAVGLRRFEEYANDQNTMVGKYPEDFCLFHHATLDVTTGEITPNATPISMGVAQHLVHNIDQVKPFINGEPDGPQSNPIP